MKKQIPIILFLLIAQLSYSQTKDTMKEFDSNFAHNVYFWLKNPDSKEDRAKFETSLKKFLGSSKYAKTAFIGTPPKATRDVVDGSFTYSMVVTFDSAASQEAYQTEEVHLTFIEESSNLWNKVIVYDAVGI
ncbi:Dabb family protein [Arenibacter sp. GZD96]|uniref:Dabb family protein n=1 Tax=Aurantibrevibacter litoralis TaxID=3106030 RepID=UPI002B00337B|nr:Dabb family protein [Arenibacter sp. GZD-96]MEA1784477.1 Dabb family protein [Arenibacter sp. GZD-96]